MKQSIITAIVVAGLGFGYYKLRNVQLQFSSAQGEIKSVARGDLTIPISATGDVGPLAWHQVKSEASGEVIEIFYEPGEMVKKGDLLIRLDKTDEQRLVDRAKAEVTRTKAMLEVARIKTRRLRITGVAKAEAFIAQLQAQFERAEFNLRKVEGLDQIGRASPDELMTVRSTYKNLQAQLSAAEVDAEDVHIQIETAEKEVTLTEAAHQVATSTQGDAEERLAETEIHSPVDGMVVKLSTQVGEVIQGGKTTFTGGTVLVVVADVSKVYVRAEVDEADIGTVRDLAPEWARPGREASTVKEVPIEEGTPVKIRVDTFHSEEFAGIIERIHPEPNSKLSTVVTYQVDILLTSENRTKLLTGMQADVEFTAQSALDVLLVPHEAIRRNEFDKLGVYIPCADPESEEACKEFVECLFGLDNGMYTEVIEGLDEGMKVFTVLPQKVGRDRDDD